MMKYVIVMILSFYSSIAFAIDDFISCSMGPGLHHKVKIFRDNKIYDTYVYYDNVGGSVEPIFGDEESSRGSDVNANCVGVKNRALVVTGEFSANAIQGIVNVYNGRGFDKILFAEKARPTRLYVGKKETWIIIPTNGYGDFSAKYVFYKHTIGDKFEPLVEGVNNYPPKMDDMEIIDLKK